MYALISLAIAVGVGIPVIRIAARRFERRRIAEGQWDAQGPTHPTEAPRNARLNRFGNRLAFDLTHGQDRDEDWPGGTKPSGSVNPEPSPDDR
jgi:hypothetical protein